MTWNASRRKTDHRDGRMEKKRKENKEEARMKFIQKLLFSLKPSDQPASSDE